MATVGQPLNLVDQDAGSIGCSATDFRDAEIGACRALVTSRSRKVRVAQRRLERNGVWTARAAGHRDIAMSRSSARR